MSENKYEIRDATLEDALSMAHRMRSVDVQEIWASSRERPLEGLVKTIKGSERSRAGLVNGEVACMFGICRKNLIGNAGIIWMLGTDLLKDHGLRFLRENKKEISRLSVEFSTLENYCDARNTTTIKWLRWLGFTIEDAQPYGVYNMPFHHFYKEVR